MAGWARGLPEEPAGLGGRRGTQREGRGRFCLWPRCWESHGHPHLSWRRASQPCREGWEHSGGRGNFGKGWPGWGQMADDLFVTTSKTPKSPLQPQAELSPQSRTRGSKLPTERARTAPPPPPSTGCQEAPFQPSLPSSLVSALRKQPSACCCCVSGWQGGSRGLRLLSRILLRPRWSAGPRTGASASHSVGTPP